MKKHIKEHWSLLAGIVDDDEKEYIREKAALDIEDIFDRDLREASFKTTLLMEDISFKPSDDGSVNSEHSMHPEQPKGYKYVDSDVNDPDHYDEKMRDDEEYDNAIKRGGIKKKENVVEDYDLELNKLISKFSLTEDWKEHIDLPGEMSDAKEEIIEVPTGLLDLLAQWRGPQSSNSYTVLTSGAQGVPKSFIEGALEEIDILANRRHRHGILSNEDRMQLTKLVNGLTSLVNENPDPNFSKPMREDEGDSKFGLTPDNPDSSPPSNIEEDSLHSSYSDNKDLVAALIGGHGILGITGDKGATDPEYWRPLGLMDNNDWEIVWLNDVPADVANRLENWEEHFSDERSAAAAIVPYMGEVIESNSDLPEIHDHPEMEDGKDWDNEDLIDLDDRWSLRDNDRTDKQFEKYF